MEQVTYNTMDYDEFEELIHSTYPYIKDYDFVQSEEVHNDCCYEYEVFYTELDWDQYDQKEWDTHIIKEKNYNFSAEFFLRKLHHDKVIPTGYYLIKVCW